MGSGLVGALVDGGVQLPLGVMAVGALRVWFQYRKAVVIECGRTARLRYALHTVQPELRADVIAAFASAEAASDEARITGDRTE
ncbi:hypothetical protein GCM10010211_30670 [Streptomyces albospinus]|uniref:Uncharacterized protein n=1 Tax=Streptomyces albospinus TaxID=285515 RepID=A0ABQ2V233_9ACTN|nr:hypothetical protein GCM10010211_30670 [Streptomyces albospinus]